MKSAIKIVLDPLMAKFIKVELIISHEDEDKRELYFNVLDSITDEIERFAQRAEMRVRLERAIYGDLSSRRDYERDKA